MQRSPALCILIIFLLSACGGNASPSGTPFDPNQGRSDPALLTSTTFLADITRNVAGDRLEVESLLPIGADPHSYQPTPQDLAKIADSKLLIITGAYFLLKKEILPNESAELDKE